MNRRTAPDRPVLGGAFEEYDVIYAHKKRPSEPGGLAGQFGFGWRPALFVRELP